MNRLLIVTTGGTIDKIYFDDKSDYQIGEPQIGQILNHLQVGFEFEVKAVMRKDSLHITEADRHTIHKAISSSEATHVLITHGTDSMVKTALMLTDIPGKTIVMTGALNPARFCSNICWISIIWLLVSSPLCLTRTNPSRKAWA